MFLCRWSISRPIAMTSFIIVLLLLGGNAYRKLSIDLMPSVDIPFLRISADYAGGSPEEIEVEVARRIEDAVSSQEGLKHISSICMENKCYVSMEFDMGSDIDIAATDVREKLNRIRDDFPEGVEEPVIRKIDNNATSAVALYLVGERPVDELYDYADHVLKDRFSNVPGVGEVTVRGANERQLHILVDREKLASSNLTINDLTSSLKSANVRKPAGRIRGNGMEINVTYDGEFKSFEDIKSLEIGKFEGKRVYLRDVAEVQLIPKEVRGRNFIDNRPGVMFNIIKRSDANMMAVINGVRKKVREIENSGVLPGGMEIVWFKDSGTFIQASVDDAWNSIVAGIAITAILLFVFLHDWRSTFIVMISMPVSVIVTFFVMKCMNYTLNTMTLLSLGCSVGVLVTNSIVVIENIFKHLNKNSSLKEAAEKGASEVAVAVAASALTNVVVFVPVAQMTTRTGKMLAPFAGVMVVATLVSLFISFTLTPILSFVLLKSGDAEERSHFLKILFKPWNTFYDGLCRLFDKTIGWTRKRAIYVVIFIFALCLAIWKFIIPQVGMSFLPNTDQGELTIRMEFPTNFNLQTTIKRARIAAERVSKLDFVRALTIHVGNVSGSGGQVSAAVYLAQIVVKVTPKNERIESIAEVVERVRQQLSGMKECVMTIAIPKIAGTGNCDLSMRISGDDLNELEHLGHSVVEKVRDMHITEDLDTSLRAGKNNIDVIPNRPVLQNLGISASTLGSSVRGTFEGIEVGSYRLGSRSFDIRVRQKEESGLNQLDRMSIGSLNGNPININVLAKVKTSVRTVCINRYDRERAIWVYANVAPGQALGTVANKMKKASLEILPPGYGVRFIGQVESMGETSIEFIEVIVLAIVLTYLLIVAIMESWTMPFLIMFTVPLGFIGMYLTLWLSGMTLSMMGLLGGVMLIGIVVNNAILIMDECSVCQQAGMSPGDAMQQAVSNKFRPIVMTTLASVAGMLPMAFGTGVGSELRSSCGIGVVGGLLFSGFFTVYFIPAMYFVSLKFRKSKKNC